MTSETRPVLFQAKLESHYAQRVEQQRAGAAVLKNEVLEKTQQIEQLSDEIAELRKALQVARQQGPVPRVTLPAADANGEAAAALAEKEKDLERIRKATAQQLAEFEMVKRSLMRDLQNRCEKVVELEMALDESRELYSTAVKAVNSKAQQKKMAFLERNLEQLTNIQKQLVEQNASLKKEVAVCERKLSTRNDRISSLEVMLQEAQERLASQSGKFEQQLGAVRERLEQARMQQQQQQQQQQGPGQSQLLQTHPPHGFELGYGRIAKPLRGRGAAPVTTQGIKM
ncbi:MAG: hypothetical protein BJ554DRAFT_6479 [Olpidium bornovanus]|uniref:Uncharacterized protein n=1 Tax=Olpidium bornovanus TaxID=278681 RepID=A0A8H7ZYI8_9FUNG|nr:MAG: hypothetical protein BJ554DRAFT_6479 [Olpidium bornovanus]